MYYVKYEIFYISATILREHLRTFFGNALVIPATSKGYKFKLNDFLPLYQPFLDTLQQMPPFVGYASSLM